MKFRPDPESRVKTGAEDVSRHINPATIQEAAELKQMEDAPQRFENPYHLLFEKNLAGVAISVLGEYIVDCNAAWAQIVGYDSPQEVRGLPTDEFYFHPLAEHEPILEVIRRTGSFSSPRTRLRRKDGTPVWVLFNTVLFSAENGGKLALTTAIDVGETKRAEDGLEESEQRFRSVYERSPIGIALVNSRTERFLQVNRKFCEIAGRSEEELLRSDLESITHPDDMELTREKIRQLADLEAAEVVLEKRYVRPDGSVRWVKVVAVPMWGEGEAARWHVGLVEDITERKRAEARLQEYEKVVEGIDDMIVVIDQDYRYVIANQTFLNRRGLKLEQVIGHPASEIVEKKAYETLVKAKIEECFQGRVVVYEMKYGYDKLGEKETCTCRTFRSKGLRALTGSSRSCGT
jgi:PAS domain S-box-containing protein